VFGELTINATGNFGMKWICLQGDGCGWLRDQLNGENRTKYKVEPGAVGKLPKSLF